MHVLSSYSHLHSPKALGSEQTYAPLQQTEDRKIHLTTIQSFVALIYVLYSPEILEDIMKFRNMKDNVTYNLV